jgi:hypothetical protein
MVRGGSDLEKADAGANDPWRERFDVERIGEGVAIRH